MDLDTRTGKWLKKAGNKQRSGDLSAARSFYNKVLKLDPQHLDANYLMGALYAEQGNLDKALQYTLAAEGLDPRSPYIKNNLANLYRMQGKETQAETCFRQALSIQPDMAEALNNLAILYRRQRRYQEAIDLYRRAIQSKPDFIAAHFNLGQTYTEMGIMDDAANCFIRALSINPDHYPSHNGLGDYYSSCKQTEKARRHYESYLNHCATDECGVVLKLAYLNKGELPQRQSAEVVQHSYRLKARHWDQDVKRPDMEFLGPQIIENLATFCLDHSPLAILDLGCGTGLCAPFLKSRASVLTGLDLSPEMLREAKKKQIYDELIQGDAQDYLQETEKTFDLMIASGVLIFFADLNPIMTAAAGPLKPGGHFIFSAYQSNAAPVQIRSNLHFGHSEAHIRQAADNSGFEVVVLEKTIHEYDYGQAQAGYGVVLRKKL